MSESTEKKFRRVVKKEKKLIMNSIIRDIFREPFKVRLNLAWRILWRK